MELVPDEIIKHILSFLPPIDMVRFALTEKQKLKYRELAIKIFSDKLYSLVKIDKRYEINGSIIYDLLNGIKKKKYLATVVCEEDPELQINNMTYKFMDDATLNYIAFDHVEIGILRKSSLYDPFFLDCYPLLSRGKFSNGVLYMDNLNDLINNESRIVSDVEQFKKLLTKLVHDYKRMSDDQQNEFRVPLPVFDVDVSNHGGYVVVNGEKNSIRLRDFFALRMNYNQIKLTRELYFFILNGIKFKDEYIEKHRHLIMFIV